MPDTNELLRVIKQAALEAVEAARPVHLIFGKVIDPSPKIQVDQKLVLGPLQLVLSRNVTNYQTVIKGESVMVENGLVVGDEVILIRQHGGQKFIVLDRVGK